MKFPVVIAPPEDEVALAAEAAAEEEDLDVADPIYIFFKKSVFNFFLF